MLCEAKLPFLFTLLFYLLSGNDNFLSEKREKRKEKREEYKKKRQSSVENCRFFLPRPKGFEPLTIGIGIRYSIRAELRTVITTDYILPHKREKVKGFERKLFYDGSIVR